MISIIKRRCTFCKKKLLINTTWYFQNDNVYCSKICRVNYNLKQNDKVYIGSINL